MLIDQHGRTIDYLRMAVTDRCNLRCLYCMPAEGLPWEKQSALLSKEEILRALRLFSSLGISKVRFTGGEPFLRKDFLEILEETAQSNWFRQISITTNGTLTFPHIDFLKRCGVQSVNLSIDTLHPERFVQMTRRDDLSEVLKTLHGLMDAGIHVRINAVIMDGKNEEDIVDLTELTKQLPVDVRFIEEMPFNGEGQRKPLKWNFKAIIQEIERSFGFLEKCNDEPHSTSTNYRLPDAKGMVGVIPAFSRTFCGTCNRVRITPQGQMKTCLYEGGGYSLRDAFRDQRNDQEVLGMIAQKIMGRVKDGHEAERIRRENPVHESMATIGG